MFFFLSKALVFFIQPINWTVLLLLIALLTKREKLRRRCFYWGVGMLLFFTNPLLNHFMVSWWEADAVTIESLEGEHDIALVLGGYVNFRSDAPKDRVNFNERSNRLINALELHKIGKVDQLLLSGGIGSLMDREFNEATEVVRFLHRLEIPDSVLLRETRSRNTYENIVYSKAIIDSLKPDARVLLFTSAFHMPRALAICKKQGLEVTAFPTDIIQDPLSWNPQNWLLPDTGGFHLWALFIKEWVGYVVYKMKGYA